LPKDLKVDCRVVLEYGNKNNVRQIIYPLLYSVPGVPSLLLLARTILRLHYFTLYQLRKEKRFTSIDLVEWAERNMIINGVAMMMMRVIGIVVLDTYML